VSTDALKQTTQHKL